MNKETLEHLSCLVDGEISKDTGRFMLRRLGSDNELRETWARYHLVRDCLRHQEGNLVADDFSSKVHQAIVDEASQPASRRFSAKWLKPVSGMAIAASVALMAIVTVGPGQDPSNSQVDGLADTTPLKSFVSPNSILGATPVSQAVNTAGANNSSRRMNSYLLRHYQVTGSTGGKGFVSFVPIVVYRGSTPPSAENLETDEQTPDNGSESIER